MMNFLTTSYEHLFKAALALTLVCLSAYLARRRWEDRRAKKKLAEAVKLELNVPMSLHPVIDPDVCIGSGSCIQACPEGQILGLIDGVATLVNASKLHRPWPVRGRVPGQRDQAGLRLGRARRRPPRD